VIDTDHAEVDYASPHVSTPKTLAEVVVGTGSMQGLPTDEVLDSRSFTYQLNPNLQNNIN
jgi:hypothetical protein